MSDGDLTNVTNEVDLNNVQVYYIYYLNVPTTDADGVTTTTVSEVADITNYKAFFSYSDGNFTTTSDGVVDTINKDNPLNITEISYTTNGVIFCQKDTSIFLIEPGVNTQSYNVGNTVNLINDPSVYTGPTCFLYDSMIETPNGRIPVQDIRPGDEVTVYVDGEFASRKIVWAGKSHAVIRQGFPDDEAGYPVCILKDAISDGVPYKDMLITAEHSLFFDGRFVPARMLVNGRSIFYDKSITSYDYYHIETEKHSVITADGMLTESYLDTGNRHTFHQDGNVVTFTPSRNLTWDDAAVPLGVSREFVEPLFRQAEARAISAGITQKDAAPELTEEANLHLVIDTGAVIHPTRKHNGRVMFMIPTGVKSVRIVSNASRPSDVIGSFVDDRRYFGVAVGEITMFEAGRSHSVTVHLTEKELAGWNTLEWEDTRWTSGNALLPLGVRQPNSIALIAIQIKKAGPYLLDDAVTRKTALQA